MKYERPLENPINIPSCRLAVVGYLDWCPTKFTCSGYSKRNSKKSVCRCKDCGQSQGKLLARAHCAGQSEWDNACTCIPSFYGNTDTRVQKKTTGDMALQIRNADCKKHGYTADLNDLMHVRNGVLEGPITSKPHCPHCDNPQAPSGCPSCT